LLAFLPCIYYLDEKGLNDNLRLDSDAPKPARQARVEPVGKIPERRILVLLGQRRNFTDSNMNSDDDDFRQVTSFSSLGHHRETSQALKRVKRSLAHRGFEGDFSYRLVRGILDIGMMNGHGLLNANVISDMIS
jgi:hypothetical protein